MLFTLYSTVLLGLLFGNVKGENQEGDQAVVVKLNPFVAKSKKVIQFRGDGRYKRGENIPEKSLLYLEFPESFFSDPKLKSLYSSLIGGGGSEKTRSTKSTNIVFQIDPAGFDESEGKVNENAESKGKRKREVMRDSDETAFQLTILPGHNPRPLVRYHLGQKSSSRSWCLESKPEDSVKGRHTSSGYSEEFPGATPTMCHPSKPVTPRPRMCGGTYPELPRKYDPCACSTDGLSPTEPTTLVDDYTMCKSSPPLTSSSISLCYTTEPCKPRTSFPPFAQDFDTLRPAEPPQKPSCPPCSSTTTCSTTCSTACPALQEEASPMEQQDLGRNIGRHKRRIEPPQYPPYRGSSWIGCGKDLPSYPNPYGMRDPGHGWKDLFNPGCPGLNYKCPSTCAPWPWPAKLRPPCPSCQLPSLPRSGGKACPMCAPRCGKCRPGCPNPCPTCCPMALCIPCGPRCPNPCPTCCPVPLCYKIGPCDRIEGNSSTPLRLKRFWHRNNSLVNSTASVMRFSDFAMKSNLPTGRRLKRKLWIYKPKHGFRKIFFRSPDSRTK